jgi:tetratricopeptide (TPR) repeat protein
VRVPDLRAQFRSAIEALSPGEVSVPVAIGHEYFLFQVVDEGEQDWIFLDESGYRALREGSGEQAIESFEAAARQAEESGLGNLRVARSLITLAEAYRAGARPHAAAPLYDRAIRLLDEALGADHPSAGAARSYRDGFHQSLLARLLEGLTVALNLASFRDDQFEQGVAGFEETLELAGLDEASYLLIQDSLLEAGLTDLAERVFHRGLERFATSRMMHYYHAELFARSRKLPEALDAFREASRMGPGPGLDEASNRQQEAFIYLRMGDLYSNLYEYDRALEAYDRALTIDPGTPGLRRAVGKLYSGIDRLDDALAEYTRAVAEQPDEVEVHRGLAETCLALGRWAEAVEAADRAIAIDPADFESHYIRGMALLQMGARGEGEEALEQFRRLDAEVQSSAATAREVGRIRDRAIEAFAAGAPETAVRLLREGIGAYPAAGALYLTLGVTCLKLGLYGEAGDTFRSMIDLGVGDHFLVHRNLFESYRALGDLEASRRHQTRYLEGRAAALPLRIQP